MSFMPRQQRERLVEKLPLRVSTQQTITDRQVLRAELLRIRRERLSFNNQEYMPGIVAMAVPVMLDTRRACAAVAIQSSAQRNTAQALLAHLPELRQAAARMADTFRENHAGI